MTPAVFSFIETKDLTDSEINSLFSKAKNIKAQFHKTGQFPSVLSGRPLVGLLFFEASTRTRLSFEMAAKRLGAAVTFFDGASKEGTSLIKGETFDDTFWTFHAMRPDVMVVRCGEELNLPAFRDKVSIPIINAGYGVHSHPTQALLDVFTMLESFESLQGKNILFAGDVLHSRVAHSHMELLPRLGAKVGVVGPESLRQGVGKDIQAFSTLKDALPWTDVFIALRVQFERHKGETFFGRDEYIRDYQLRESHGSLLKKNALVFHPGPVNWGLELDPSVRALPHFKMWDQKQNGVYVRAALLEMIMAKNAKVKNV